jgi:hypothetical protein
MKSLMYLGLTAVLLSQGTVHAQSKSSNGWQSLFDGKDLKGWRQATKDSVPVAAWSAANGELTFDPSKGHGSDIITEKAFKNFELSIDFKISEGGNSGIKYFLLPNTNLGCEFQVIDDSKHPDAKLGRDGDRTTGSLYDIMPAPKDKPMKPAGEWNNVRIIVRGDKVEHWLNGRKILEYDRSSEAFKQAIALSKFKTTKGFAMTSPSPILLQAHGDLVHYRDIKIKEL